MFVNYTTVRTRNLCSRWPGVSERLKGRRLNAGRLPGHAGRAGLIPLNARGKQRVFAPESKDGN
jgi:hypothetical protein